MWFSWVLIGWFSFNILVSQARVGKDSSSTANPQNVANVSMLIHLALILGVVLVYMR